MSKSIDQNIQAFRGLAIIAVLLIHLPLTNGSDNVIALYRQMLNFAVPLFFFISGYFFQEEKWKKTVKRLLFPYIIWVTFYYVWNIILPLIKNEPSSWPKYNWFEIIFFGRTQMQLYYISVLIQLVFVHKLVARIKLNTFKLGG